MDCRRGGRLRRRHAGGTAALSWSTLTVYLVAVVIPLSLGGLVVPSARSQGGFRLYTEPDIERLDLVKRMKPLGFQLDEMRDLLAALDPSADATIPSEEQRARLSRYSETADQRCAELRAKLETAEEFAAMLRKSLKRSRQATATAR